ncbi:hypothetical protein CV102_18430 [Natronococcus pandeyae]|uniref:Uncharacterized protein n=1 Tax=Natronococcus pandeyae TaxID=2055836 RepID=A0A8J8Q2K6_9EURY|nr:hypothetical protein CV102_18430 [Natronococcus pandeyae]
MSAERVRFGSSGTEAAMDERQRHSCPESVQLERRSSSGIDREEVVFVGAPDPRWHDPADLAAASVGRL